MMPLVAGVGVLLAVIAAILMWPKGAPDAGERKRATAAGASDRAGKGADGVDGRNGQAAGVAARTNDEPSAPGGGGRMNPAVRLPNVGMAPEGGGAPKDDTPPAFANVAEEIAWYEGRLGRAAKTLEARKKFYDRLPDVRARVAAGPDPQRQLEAFEGRKKIVEDNYAKAQADVIEIEGKLKSLRGQ